MPRSDSSRRNLAGRALIGLLWLTALVAAPAQGFFQWEQQDLAIEARGLARGFGIYNLYPDAAAFYEDRRAAGAGGLLRLLAEGHAGDQWGGELNIYDIFVPAELAGPNSLTAGFPADVERSAALEHSQSSDDYARLAVDRLNVRASVGRLDLRIGRQPINLATTYYFTPNDFFAPFAAQVFYRVYKPGVDAARATVRLAALSQLEFIGVLGYGRDPSSATGWSREPDPERGSGLVRGSAVYGGIEWAGLAGWIRDREVFGAALQGELWQWLGIRAEGHYADPDDPRIEAYSEIAAGIEHRWESSLELRLEYFHHGRGATAVEAYSGDTGGYLARRYTAFGAGYELTPLLRGELLLLNNWVDYSRLLAVHAVYSLSDETELDLSVNLPAGRQPEGTQLRSEFGSYPDSLLLELRAYF